MKYVSIKKLQVNITKTVPYQYDSIKKSIKVLGPINPPDMAAEVYQLISFVNETKHTVDKTYYYRPKTWWDAFKEQYFPKWILRKFPIKTENIIAYTAHKFICPHVYYPGDKPDTHVLFLSQGLDDVEEV